VTGEVWIRMLGSISYLSSPASGDLMGAALHARTVCRSYPSADKGVQVPPINQCWTQKWWYSGTEMECPTHPICAASHRFGNRGHDCLKPRDFRCAVSRWIRIVVMIALGPATFAVQ
jgi:hypothetical protein